MNIEQPSITEQRVKIFKALADDTRLGIIKNLYASKEEMSCTEAGADCVSSKSNASYHFRTLREAGLIKVRKEAQTKFVSLNKETFDRFLPGFLDTL
ncbi:helix-turn-helix transcriptional regulator [Brevibacillus sp. SYP-B805]|uniref:ArsR/SmtB family transcription factor n=1 Tax=Brevibacillus sp. SYP-B805 TaxID=1578199 RepID=UPI0013ED90BA|nr:metalloregulator ArsR/SmtB family transcription factor [Brevibacillus sp. SYP-B805]NGQ96658.1 helix-turn-helix transcriptional regulator [Brevibacillus sp. SYP-B805]